MAARLVESFLAAIAGVGVTLALLLLLFPAPFEFAQYVFDVNHACYLVVTATNSWETRLVERGMFLAPFEFAQFVIGYNCKGLVD